MLYSIVTVYDAAMTAFGRPVFVASKGAALRSFSDEVRNPKSEEMFRHPEDFTLYFIGTWDDANGKFEAPREPERLINGRECKMEGQ